MYGLHPLARFRLRHIPGPAFHWFKGNVDEVVAAGGLHEAYDRWATRYGPVFRVFLGGQPVVVVADGGLARTVSVKHGSRPPFRGPAELVFDNPLAPRASRLNAMREHDMLQTQDAAYHRGLKNAWLPMFNADSLARHAPVMDAAAARLVERMRAAADTEVDAQALLGDLTMDVVLAVAFGVDAGVQSDQPSAESAALVSAARLIFRTQQRSTRYFAAVQALPAALAPLARLAATLFPDAPLRAVVAARRLVYDRVFSLLKEARARRAAGAGGDARVGRAVRTGSFLDLMMGATLDGGRPLTDAEVATASFTMALAAFETTATTLAFIVYHVARRPAAGDALAAELARANLGAAPDLAALTPAKLPYMHAVVCETLRLCPPGALTTRMCTKPIALGGVTVPGSRFAPIWLHNAVFTYQRDPAVWGPDASEWKPERWLADDGAGKGDWFTPFGSNASSLACVGKRMAEAEIRLTLARLFGAGGVRFTLSPGQIPLATAMPLTLGPKHGVMVTPTLPPGEKGGARPPSAPAPATPPQAAA